MTDHQQVNRLSASEIREDGLDRAAFSTIQESTHNKPCNPDEGKRFGDFDPDMAGLEILTQDVEPELKAGVRVAMALMAEQLTEEVSGNGRPSTNTSRWVLATSPMRAGFHSRRSQSTWNR